MTVELLKDIKPADAASLLHRYALAGQAKPVGMPERFVQEALGRSSEAFARVNSKKARVIMPSLENYERKIVPMPLVNQQSAFTSA